MLPPIRKPGYVNGSDPILHSKKLVAFYNHEFSTLRLIMELLWKLTWRPNDNWTKMRIFFNVQQWINVRRIKDKDGRFWVHFDILQCLSKRFNDWALWNGKFSGSTTRSNNNGESGSPWRRPRWSLHTRKVDINDRLNLSLKILKQSMYTSTTVNNCWMRDVASMVIDLGFNDR